MNLQHSIGDVWCWTYFPQNDNDEEQKNAAADNGQRDDPERNLSPHRSSANDRHERLHLQQQV